MQMQMCQCLSVVLLSSPRLASIFQFMRVVTAGEEDEDEEDKEGNMYCIQYLSRGREEKEGRMGGSGMRFGESLRRERRCGDAEMRIRGDAETRGNGSGIGDILLIYWRSEVVGGKGRHIIVLVIG